MYGVLRRTAHCAEFGGGGYPVSTSSILSAAGSRLISALPDTRAGGIIVLSAMAGSTGSALYLAGSALYFTRYAGLTSTQLGFGLAAAGLVGFSTTVPIVRLADRFGPRNVLLGAYLWRAVGYLAYLAVHGFAAFLVTACLLFVMDRATRPLNQALVGSMLAGPQRSRTMGMVRSVRNIGFTAGFGLAGIALAAGTAFAFRVLFVGTAAGFLLVFSLLLLLPDTPRAADSVRPAGPAEPGSEGDAGQPAQRTAVTPPLRNRRFVAATAANGVLFLHDAILMTVLPLWVGEHTRAPLWMITVLVTTNTTLTVLGQVRITRDVDSLASAARATMRSALLLSGACLAFVLSAAVSEAAWACVTLMIALLLLTGGELLHSASAWEISFALSPKRAQSRYLAFFDLGYSASEISGPAVILWLLARTGSAGWLVLACAFPVAAAVSGYGTRVGLPADAAVDDVDDVDDNEEVRTP